MRRCHGGIARRTKSIPMRAMGRGKGGEGSQQKHRKTLMKREDKQGKKERGRGAARPQGQKGCRACQGGVHRFIRSSDFPGHQNRCTIVFITSVVCSSVFCMCILFGNWVYCTQLLFHRLNRSSEFPGHARTPLLKCWSRIRIRYVKSMYVRFVSTILHH